jgi:hypothetical protein
MVQLRQAVAQPTAALKRGQEQQQYSSKFFSSQEEKRRFKGRCENLARKRLAAKKF